ncbi:MAG: GAF domain-containing protein, partial [Anaerolineales bacterium]|nr:GAF domain-containing protein [Anaerolineales bacterium]
GTVEFGLNVDQNLIEELKKQYDADWQILLSRKPAEIATFAGSVANASGPNDNLILQASTLSVPFFAPASDYARALADEPTINNNVEFDGSEYAIYTVPLHDFSGNVIGVVDIVSNRTAVVQAQTNKVLTAVAVAVLSLFVVGTGLIYLITRTLHPLQDITEMATAMTAGDLNRTIPVSSNDELGLLAQDFNSMAQSLNELIETLELRVTQRTQALETTMQVSQSLTTILNQDQLVSDVVELIRSAFDYYQVQIYLLDTNENQLVLAGSTGEAGRRMLAQDHTLSLGQGLVGRAAAANELVLIQDVQQDLDWLPNPLLPDTKAEVGVPIRFQTEVLGVLDVQHNVVNGLDEEQTRTLQTIAAQIAIALRNIRLYEDAQTRATRESQLNEISQRIRSAADIDSVLRVAVKEIGQATRARRTSVTLGQGAGENGRSEN